MNSTIQNCTISDNLAESVNAIAGGIYSSYCTIQNSILWNNTNGNFFSLDSINQYNCIENWTNLINGIITNNPEFRDPNFDNYRLESYSPCINIGNNAYAAGSWDLDGNPRIIDGIVDMGAYEYVPEPVSIMISFLYCFYLINRKNLFE
jgi:hypothetical protein